MLTAATVVEEEADTEVEAGATTIGATTTEAAIVVVEEG